MEDLDSIKKRQANDEAAKQQNKDGKVKPEQKPKGDGIVFDAGDGVKKTNTPNKP